jgi:pyruvate-ferredoxin/flavodoxin oxidoreductase
MTMFDLLGYHIKANPKYGSEKKGQPTTYYLAAAPEPIRINCEYYYVDVVLSPDPNVFKHTNALAGLKKGGTFIIQSDKETPEEFWDSIPKQYQQYILLNDINVYYIDAFKIAREEASNVELQFRMQGIAFQGAFFAASSVMKDADLTQDTLFKAIEEQLQHKFGSKGVRVVEDNLRVVHRGFSEITKLAAQPQGTGKAMSMTMIEPKIPIMLKREPASKANLTNVHRFWEQTGNFYLRGMGNDNLTDPFIGLSCMPAVSAVFRDMTGIRFEHPQWDAEKCTGCGKCWTICPDTAIPGLVSEFSGIINTTINQLKKNGEELTHLPKAARQMEGKWRALVDAAGNDENVMTLKDTAIRETIEASTLSGSQKEVLEKEFDLFSKAMEGLKFASTRPFFSVLEKKNKNSGGLLSITVNPYTCKGCMECVEVCGDDALKAVKQTDESVEELQRLWSHYIDMPNTPEKYIRIDDLEEGIGALETLLLNKDAYLAVASGDGACMGCSEKTIVHLFVATVEALMQPRIKKHIEHLTDLIAKMEKHIQMKLVEGMSVEEMGKALGTENQGELTLSDLSAKLEKNSNRTIDQDWLRWATQLVKKLKNLKWKYTEGITGKGRSPMGMLNATGCSSVWGSTYPFNPYPFPWANHLFQDSPSLAMGVFEGHMAKMAEGFKTIRIAEMELNGGYNAEEHDEFFKYMNWNHFTDDEYHLCPPVVTVGGDGAMYDIGFQNLSRALMSGKPIKILILDTQVYSNTGGQACTSGFIGQVSDMAQYGKAIQGKTEFRKEIGLIGMAHRTSYILQGVTANTTHMIEGFIEGLMTKRPALFNLYTTCQPEHGVPDDAGANQAKLALESRAYPIFKYNPDLGDTAEACFNLEGNPAMHEDWPTYKLQYKENGQEKTMELPMTFADFAVTEARFRKQFKKSPASTWNDSMIPLHEFLELDESDREGQFPFIWAVNQKNELTRLLVADPMVKSCEERIHFWHMLKGLAGVKPETDEGDMESRIRNEVVSNIASGLMQLAGGNAGSLQGLQAMATSSAAPAQAPAAATNPDFMAPWLDTEDCTSCDECTNFNPRIFKYNADGKAEIVNPDGGPYQDLVKASEKCPAGVIHPGLPADLSAKDIDKWIKRGEKYN